MSEMKRSYWFGPFHLDTANNLLFKDGKVEHLDATRFAVLCLLVENRGRSLSTREIIGKIWHNTAVEDNNVTQAISAIRKALDDSNSNPKYVKTIPAQKKEKEGTKYCFIAEVRTEDPRADEGQKPTPPQLGPIKGDSTNAFQVWHRGQGKAIKHAIRIGVAVSVISSSFALFKGEPVERWASIIQLSVISLLFILFLPRSNQSNKDKSKLDEVAATLGYDEPEKLNEALTQVEQLEEKYVFYWRLVWGSWMCLYVILLLTNSPDASSQQNQATFPWIDILKNIVNNSNTMLIIACYSILYKPVISDAKSQPKSESERLKDKLFIGGFSIVAFSFIEFLLLWYERSNSWFGINAGNLVQNLSSLSSGIAAGIALALYVGRLQSKYFDPPPLLIMALFLYIAIQPFYWNLAAPPLFPDTKISNIEPLSIDPKFSLPEFNDLSNQIAKHNDQIATNNKQIKSYDAQDAKKDKISLIGKIVLINLTLLLKCVLYLYTTWILKSGRLLFYLERMGKIDQKQVDNEWEAFQVLLQKET
jgi:DNA-binding winged helix-turn-helix (wHTH) protein